MDLNLLRPELCIAAWMLALLVIDMFLPVGKKSFLWLVALTGTAAAGFLALQPFTLGTVHDSYVLDAFGAYFKPLFVLVAAIVIILTRVFGSQMSDHPGPFYALLFTSLLGALILSSVNDLILLFLGLELLTFSLYIMAAYLKTDKRSVEAGMKYLIMGSLSSGFLVYGIALLYGAVGSTQLPAIHAFLAQGSVPLTAQAGILLVLSGLGFKLAAFPFQFWLADVYEGAPTPVVAFLSVGSKMAGAVALLRVFQFGFLPLQEWWAPILAGLSALTLIYGNLGAIPQTNIKRLLGYSSIGHAGYILMGLSIPTIDGVRAVAFYLFAYLFGTLAVFLVVCAATTPLGGENLDDYRGLSKRSPLLAAGMFIGLLSLAGVPPLAGFVGKLLVLLTAVENNRLWLAVLGAVNVAVSLYYYLMIVKRMYLDAPKSNAPIQTSALTNATLAFLVLSILAIGIFQEPFLLRIHAAFLF